MSQGQEKGDNALLMGIGWFVGTVLGHTLRFPFQLPKRIYDFFAHDSRYIWFDYIFFAYGLFFTGNLITQLIFTDGDYGAMVIYIFAYGTSIMLMNFISLGIKRIATFHPMLAWVGWVPSFSTGPSEFQTWKDPDASQAHMRGTEIHDVRPGMKKNKDLALNIHLGGVPIDYNNECEHFLISGKTGSGKTQAINSILRSVRERGQVAIIADPAGGYFQRFAQKGEFLLNPFDDRTSNWSPFLEIEADYDCQRIARAAIPDGSGDGKEWHFYAQTLLAEVLKKQWELQNHSIKELLRLIMSAPAKDLATLLENTPAATLTQKGNEKMLSNTRAISATYLNVWSYLEDIGSFSIRQYVRSAAAQEHDRWLYLTYRDAQMAMLRTLVATWLEIAIVEGLSLSESPDRRLFFIMDELDSLGKVSSLRAGLTKLRKYGGVCVNGLQTIAQLRDTYGKEEAQTLLSCMSTKLLLAAGDAETAEYFSKEIGDRQINRSKVSTGRNEKDFGGFGEGGSNTTNSTETVIERAVLASEISNLPNLTGFLKPVGRPVMRVTLDYVPMENFFTPFEPKSRKS